MFSFQWFQLASHRLIQLIRRYFFTHFSMLALSLEPFMRWTN